jgi:cytochrome d ubiquinol oxidase subunit I
MHPDGDGPVLRTRDALSSSEVVTPSQVVGSIVMFSFIYLMLFAVWLYVLNAKIQHGPDEAEAPPPTETGAEDLLEAAARRANPSGYSLTESRQSPAASPPSAARP